MAQSVALLLATNYLVALDALVVLIVLLAKLFPELGLRHDDLTHILPFRAFRATMQLKRVLLPVAL